MQEPDEKKPTLWQVIQSVLASFLGVQSASAHQRDFTKGNPWAYILIGIVATVLFVLALVGVVRWVLAGT